MSIQQISFILGGVLIAVSLLGGGIEIRDLRVPSLGKVTRVLSFVGGIGFVAFAVLWRAPSLSQRCDTDLSRPDLFGTSS